MLFLALSGCESANQPPATAKSPSQETVLVTPPTPPKSPSTEIQIPVVASPTPPTGLGKTPAFALRVNCAATEPYTDKAGNLWVADQEMGADKQWGAEGGMTVDRGDVNIPGTVAPRIYQLERYSMPAYTFTVPNGKYTVRLHFAETYDGITGDGQRVFSVSINNNVVLQDFDPYKVAGGLQKPIVKEFKSIAVTNGKLVIGFTANIQNQEINGIEILSE
jgi:hypothetical protein